MTTPIATDGATDVQVTTGTGGAPVVPIGAGGAVVIPNPSGTGGATLPTGTGGATASPSGTAGQPGMPTTQPGEGNLSNGCRIGHGGSSSVFALLVGLAYLAIRRRRAGRKS